MVSSGRSRRVDEPVEQRGPAGLAVVAGVVALADQNWQELGAGAEVGAGLAGGLHAAVEFGGAGAQAVAEHPGVCFAAQPGHAGGLVVGGQCGRLPVEGAGLGADRGVLVGHDPVGDLGVDQGHFQGAVFYMRVIQRR